MTLWTEEEKNYLFRSGFSFQTDALDYYAMLGDMTILPLVDKLLDDELGLISEKEHMLWTCQLLIDFYTRIGDEAKVKVIQTKKEGIKAKLKST